MNYIRAFIAGLALPSVLIPFLMSLLITLKKPQALDMPFFHFIPIFWGIWNVLFVLVFNKILRGDLGTRMLIAGAILGFLVAVYGVFWLNLPAVLGLSSVWGFLPLIGAPIAYAILWWLVVRPLNALLGVKTN